METRTLRLVVIVILTALGAIPSGSLTLYIQKDSPGQGQESNWLPAPNAPPFIVMRIYWPKESALNGTWRPPAVQRIK